MCFECVKKRGSPCGWSPLYCVRHFPYAKACSNGAIKLRQSRFTACCRRGEHEAHSRTVNEWVLWCKLGCGLTTHIRKQQQVVTINQRRRLSCYQYYQMPLPINTACMVVCPADRHMCHGDLARKTMLECTQYVNQDVGLFERAICVSFINHPNITNMFLQIFCRR